MVADNKRKVEVFKLKEGMKFKLKNNSYWNWYLPNEIFIVKEIKMELGVMKYISTLLGSSTLFGEKDINWDKTIEINNEFTGGKMKRLDVRKEYKDGNILIAPIVYADDYLLISTYSNKHETTTIRVGEDYLTSLAKVNAMLKAMELNYELYEGVDWNKVEEGTEITWIEEYIVYEAPNGILRRLGKFVKYIADIKKLVVRTGDEVYIVDEDKVELSK